MNEVRRAPSQPKVFGTQQAWVNYQPRPSVYALIPNERCQIAIVAYRGGLFLPGGGLQAGEANLEALNREIIEELGRLLSQSVKFSEAVEYLQDRSNRLFYCLHTTIYLAGLHPSVSLEPEPGHKCLWMTPEKAIHKLQRPCHAWAVEEILNQSRYRGAKES
jgi:8-oxo-dGTP diphosphatase